MRIDTMSQGSEIVLRVLKEGKISVGEADALLKALGDEGDDTPPPSSSGFQTPLSPPPAIGVGGLDALLAALDTL